MKVSPSLTQYDDVLSLILPILGTVPLFPMVRLNNLRFAYRHFCSGLGQVRIMDSQSLWYYRDQLQRIVEESLEVSLVICKADLLDFSIGKIFDVFYQILPTAFVLNTGYWPFFNSLKKQSICVCGRYGMYCRHSRQQYHWIDLDKLTFDNSIVFKNGTGTVLTLLDAGIELTPITTGILGYSINMKLTFEYKKSERGRPRRMRDGNADGVFRVLLCSSYSLQKEYYPSLHCIMFQPSPFFHETYGTYFPKLRQARERFGPTPKDIKQTFYTVLVENMPPFSLVLQCVNVPIYRDVVSPIPVTLFYMEQLKPRKPSRSKETQTENFDDTEVWRYRELIGNLKPLWNESMSTSCESLYRKPTEKLNDLFQTYILNDDAVDSTYSFRSTIVKQEPVDFDHVYDSQSNLPLGEWQFEKAVSRRKIRNRIQSVQKLEDTAQSTDISSRQNHLTSAPSTSYASAVKSSAPPKADSKCNLNGNIAKLDSYRKDPEFQWLDTQFPDLPNTETEKPAKIDEIFDIAEEFISQEIGINNM